MITHYSLAPLKRKYDCGAFFDVSNQRMERGDPMPDFFQKHGFDKLCQPIDDNIYVSALRHGLSLPIPFFVFGSFALAFLHLPIPAY